MCIIYESDGRAVKTISIVSCNLQWGKKTKQPHTLCRLTINFVAILQIKSVFENGSY